MGVTPKIIIGLGNPDTKYQNTYHNVGHLFIDYLEKMRTTKAALLKSNTYMNRSGNFVLGELKKHNAEPDELLIVHDESDLTLGNYRLSYGRGSAGHKGVESIIKTLKTNNFWRLRLGIRPPKERIRQQAEKFVLKKISRANLEILKNVFAEAANEILF